MNQLKKTPLHELHQRLGGRMVDFGGWSLPVQYTSVIAEHQIVRRDCGIFDTSHMGQFFLRGKGVPDAVDRLISNDFRSLPFGKAQYAGLLTEAGTFIDDLIAYKISEEETLLVVNAGNIEKDLAWVKKQMPAGISVSDESPAWAMLAVQGPKAPGVLEAVFPSTHLKLPSFGFTKTAWNGQPVWYARTGYTGEDGAELLVPASSGSALFEALMAAGAKPCGLGSRDSLRLEKGLSLYGHEIDDTTNALEAGLAWVVGFQKPGFIGKEALVQIKAAGAARRLTGLVMEGRSVARAGYPVLDMNGTAIGQVTSGTFAPTLGKNIALAYLSKGYGESRVQIAIRDGRHPATLCKRNFSDISPVVPPIKQESP